MDEKQFYTIEGTRPGKVALESASTEPVAAAAAPETAPETAPAAAPAGIPQSTLQGQKGAPRPDYSAPRNISERSFRMPPRHGRRSWAVFTLIVLSAVAGLAVVWVTITGVGGTTAQIVAGVVFTALVIAALFLLLDPDYLAARLSGDILAITSQTLAAMEKEGMTSKAAQRICEILLPTTPAIAVAITDAHNVLGYAGYDEYHHLPGSPIATRGTREVLETGQETALYTNEAIGLPLTSARINAAIIQPLYVGRHLFGTLKFYYRRPRQVSQTQLAVAHGFAELLSTQMAAYALEEQAALATTMELKMLQAQINPHFLFNTINTISSLIRTDPTKARNLLREFAVFYRSTLENANDLIPLEREIRQVQRYFSLETARFGGERLSLEVGLQPIIQQMLVPSFMLQPIVENAVRHGRRSEGRLTVRIQGWTTPDSVVICVQDDGVGMSEEQVENMLAPQSSQGLGIAVKNVHDRMKGYFGEEASMDIRSAPGEGTTVTFTLPRSAAENLKVSAGQAASANLDRHSPTLAKDIVHTGE